MVGSTFPSRLKTSRKVVGLTLERLAKKAGCSKGLISQYENGQVGLPGADLAFALADALNVSPRWLITGKGTQTGTQGLTDNEKALILIYRGLPEGLREHLAHTAQSLSDASSTVPSRASPIIGSPKPAKFSR